MKQLANFGLLAQYSLAWQSPNNARTCACCVFELLQADRAGQQVPDGARDCF